MAGYQLYCFGESGNAYKAALMLNLCGLKWSPVWVDFFNGEARSPEYRANVNEMGEVPVLIHSDIKLTQSGVILDYLAAQTGQFGWKSSVERHEILRWMLFDNHKFTSYIATLRFMISLAKTGETPVTEFLRQRAVNALKIVDASLAKRSFLVGDRLTIADLSLCGYLYYGSELPFDLDVYSNITVWLGRIRAMPGWRHPYDLMPRRKT
jgi:glutathione S-transferase